MLNYYLDATPEELMTNAKVTAVKMHTPPTRFELELDNGKTVMFTSMESGEICFMCRDTHHSSTNVFVMAAAWLRCFSGVVEELQAACHPLLVLLLGFLWFGLVLAKPLESPCGELDLSKLG